MRSVKGKHARVSSTRRQRRFDPEFRPETNSKEPPICDPLQYSQRRITFQSREGSRSLSASESWQKPRANQSLSVEYLDSPYSSPGSGREPKKPIEAPENAFYSRSCGPTALLLVGHALDYKSLFFRVNQIIPRHNIGQAIYPIPCFLQPFDCRYPKRGSVSKSFENVELRMHSGPPGRISSCYPEQSQSYVVHIDCHAGWGMSYWNQRFDGWCRLLRSCATRPY